MIMKMINGCFMDLTFFLFLKRKKYCSLPITSSIATLVIPLEMHIQKGNSKASPEIYTALVLFGEKVTNFVAMTKERRTKDCYKTLGYLGVTVHLNCPKELNSTTTKPNRTECPVARNFSTAVLFAFPFCPFPLFRSDT